MYLSQLILNLESLNTRRLLLNPYLLHQAICRAFPDATDGGTGRVLYRLDESSLRGIATLLVQSEKEPKWDKAELLSNCLNESPKTKLYNLNPEKEQVLYFRLRANPTVKRNGKRLGILREEAQLRWLNRKASLSGFAILSCRVLPEGIEKSTKAEGDGAMSFLAARFDGLLRVDEPELFLKSVQSGIGTGKGIGFGLLSLAPVMN
ncbi:MAG: type I-E CRISPR-associated protein Cas6/Cse3/CasE [Chloroflexi bacterium]|nr:type I-E CRISPR-associated protein Cas6/Cse3/CasE [Chloroflexota bacterium]